MSVAASHGPSNGHQVPAVGDLAHYSFADEVARLAPAPVVLDDKDVAVCDRLAVVGQRHMRNEAHAFVRQAGSRSCMMVYSADLTPMVLRKRSVAQTCGLKTTLVGNKTCEWCVHKMYFAIVGGSKIISKTLFDPPILMKAKRTWDMFAIVDKRVPQLRTMRSREGISVTWNVFDRGCAGPLTRLIRRRALASIQTIESPADREFARLLDWQCRSACAAHDVSNGLANASRAPFETPAAILKTIYKGVRSIRNAIEPLTAPMSDWLGFLVATDEEEYDADIVRQCWDAVGVKPAVAQALTKCNLRCEDGVVRVHKVVLDEFEEY